MHPGEEELLALIEGELAQVEAEAALAHLAACRDCASRKADLEALVARNRDALAILDRDPPDTTADEIIDVALRRSITGPKKASGLLRAASIAILITAGAAAALALPGSPVRQAAVRLVENLRSRAEPEPPEEAGASAAGVAVQPIGRLVVVFAARQDRGAIEIALEPSSTARVESSDHAVSFSVARDSIAVDNTGSAASYVIAVPERLPSVEVRVGEVTVFLKTHDTVRALVPMRDSRTTIPFESIR